MKVLVALFILMPLSLLAGEKAEVFFKNLKEGSLVRPKFKVEFGLKGMQVAPAGTVTTGTGHHHVVVDGQPVAKGEVVPTDKTHIHFGKGQTSTELELEKGLHTLTLQFADGAHKSYGPEMSSTIHIIVK